MHTRRVQISASFAVAAAALLIVSLFAAGLVATTLGQTPTPAPEPVSDASLAGIRIQDRPNEAFATLQAAVDAAQPGDLVLIPAAPDATEIEARLGATTITTDALTICSSVGGAPICADDIQAGHWELSASGWTPSPAPWTGQAILLDSGSGTGSTSFYPPDGFAVQDLHSLTLDVHFLQSNIGGAHCGAGSPRIALGIDTNGDGTRDANILVYNDALQTGCTGNTWHYADFLDATTSRWDLRQVGGQNQRTLTEARAWVDAFLGAHQIVSVNAIVDNGARAVIDNQRVNDWVLGEEQDIGCYWAQETACRWVLATERTMLDGDGAPHTLKVLSSGVTIDALTIRNTASTAAVGVILQGDNAVLAASDIQGPFQPTGHDGSATVNQIGVVVGGKGAEGVTVTGNTIRGWGNIGVLVSDGLGTGTLVTDNDILENRWHGILAEGPSPVHGAHSATIAGNRILSHGHSALRIGTSDPDVLLVRENVFGATNIHALTVQDRVSGRTIDVRLNDWQVYDALALPLRTADESGSNKIQQIPFLDANGSAEPPLVLRRAPGGGTDTFLSIAEAASDPASVPGTTVLLRPARTAYPGGAITSDGITLCAALNGACGGAREAASIAPPAPGAPALHIQAAGVTVAGLTLRGGSPVLLAQGAPDLTLTGNLIASEQSATISRLGVRIVGSDGARIEANEILGNLYPGSVALGLHESDDALVRDNKLLASGTGIYLTGSNNAMIDSNRVLGSPATSAASDTLGISMNGGAGHQSTSNLVHGAGIGLLVAGTKDVASEADRFLATRTGVEARASGLTAPFAQPEGLQVRNATLVGALTALRMNDRTSGLEVDARCNDWGAYTADSIRATRIADAGTGNAVQFTPYIAPLADAGSFPTGCLRLPQPAFSFDPQEPAAEEAVRFTDESTAGSRTIIARIWDFGDGTVLRESPPFSHPEHTYEFAGAYLATLTLIDAGGSEASTIRLVAVTGPGPEIQAPASENVKAGATLSIPIETKGLRGQVTMAAQGLPASAELIKLGNGAKKSNWQLVWKPEDHHVGTHVITLNAADGFGNLAIHELLLQIDGPAAPPRDVRFAQNTPVPGPAIPGQPLIFETTIRNPDAQPVEIHLAPSTAQGWPATPIGGHAVTLGPGETRSVAFTVHVGQAVSSLVRLEALPVGSPDALVVKTWNVRVPVQTSVAMSQTAMGDAIAGSVVVRYLDGSPAADRTIEWQRTYSLDPLRQFGASGTGRTDENGVYAFTFPTSDHGAQLPGTHTLAVDVYSPHAERTVHEYSVGV